MRQDPHSGRRRGAAGFSLLEMLCVLAILASAAALSFPNVWRRPVEAGLRATALDMAGALRAARMEAIRHNRAAAFFIDVGARQYWVGGGGPRRAIPAALAVEATLPESGRLTDGAGRYAFYPDGSAGGGAIRLTRQGGPQGSGATIGINWLTGAAEVSWDR
ncbi:MAG: GspH/FimT family pseudopilin [Hyphomicrobium sp.]